MSYIEFLEMTAESLRKEMPGACTEITTVEKVQNGTYTGISVKTGNCAVCFNAADLYERYEADPKEIGTITREILRRAEEGLKRIPNIPVDRIVDYEWVKDRLAVQLIPAERNRKVLETAPHRDFLDLAAVCRIEAGENAYALVTESMLNAFGVPKDRIMEDAFKSHWENLKPVLRNMSSVLYGLSEGSVEIPASPLWVATNRKQTWGASAMLFPDFLREVSEKLGGCFFILPSSIHELLFIRDDGSVDLESLRSTVRKVNASEVSEEEYLSDNVYYYDTEEEMIQIV